MSSEIAQEWNSLGLILDKLKDSGRGYVKCSQYDGEEKAAQKVSCLPDECDGDKWCFINNHCGSWWRQCKKTDVEIKCQVTTTTTTTITTTSPPTDWSVNTYPSSWPFLGHCLDPHSAGGFFDFTLPVCESGRKPDFTRQAKIAIIGAGPAGVSMARLLHDRGFGNVRLIEISDRVGGKSKRFMVGGEPQELGTCYTIGKFECVEAWAHSVGLTKIIVDKERLISSEAAILQNMTAPNYGTNSVYVADYAFRRFGLDPSAFEVEYDSAVHAYASHWAATMGQTQYMFPKQDQIDIAALNQTFEDWLLQRGLAALIPVLHFSMSGQGYGTPDKMPALYGLMWTHPNLLFKAEERHGVFKEGWQELWERLISHSNIDLHLRTEVQSIARSGEGASITYKDGTKEPFDWLIMAAPMPKALELLSDATATERDLLGSFSYHELTSSIMDVKSSGILPADFELFSWADRIPHQSNYYRMTVSGEHIKRELYDVDGDDGPFTVRHTPNIKDGSQSKNAVSVFQISDPSNSDANLTSLAQQDMRKYGLEAELLHRERWDYMPFHMLDDVVTGLKPWRIWDMQGERNTWWIGSYTSFESVADIVDYNFQLVRSRLCDL